MALRSSLSSKIRTATRSNSCNARRCDSRASAAAAADEICEQRELLDRQLLRARARLDCSLLEVRIGEPVPERIAQCLAPLRKRGADHARKNQLVAGGEAQCFARHEPHHR